MSGTARLVAALLGLVVAAFAVTTIPGVRQAPGFSTGYDGWLQCTGYVLAALVSARALAEQRRHAGWALIAVALLLRALGFVLFVTVVRPRVPPAYPSIADACWLASAVALLVGIVLVVRRHAPRTSRTLALDAVLGGLTAAALSLALFYDALLRLTRPEVPSGAVATNLAYPLIDVALLTLVLGLLSTAQGATTRCVAVLSTGVLGIAVVDGVFLYQAAAGTFRPGTWLGAVSLGATALVAAAAWLPDTPARRPPTEGPAGLVVPAVLAALCLLTLVYDAVARVPFAANLLAAGGAGVAIARVLVTLRVDRREAGAAMEAKQLELRRFRALVEASGDFIAIAELDGRLVYVNPAGRRLAGLAADADVGGLDIGDLLPPESHRHWQEVGRPAVLGKGHWAGESQLRTAGGGPPIPVAVSSFLIRHPATGDPWLVATVQVDISERVAAEQAVQRLADQRQVLLAHLVEAEEAERARIAADVHDDTVQAMAAVELRLLLLDQQVRQQAPDLAASVDAVRETVRGATERLRHLLFDLETPARRVDLAAALDEAAAYVFEDAVSWTRHGAVDAPEETRVTAYRIAKEAMINVRKHAAARRAEISLRRDAGGIEVAVADDGLGLDPDGGTDQPGHLGLTSMRDRAAAAGGRLVVEAPDGGGTVVRLWLPVTDDDAGGPDRDH